MKFVLALLLCSVAFGQTFRGVEYIHPNENGKAKHHVWLTGDLTIDHVGKSISYSYRGQEEIKVPFSEITMLLYERTATPRYAAGILLAWPLLFTKSKGHYLTVRYKEDDHGVFAMFRLHKVNYRQILAATEAAVGHDIERRIDR